MFCYHMPKMSEFRVIPPLETHYPLYIVPKNTIGGITVLSRPGFSKTLVLV